MAPASPIAREDLVTLKTLRRRLRTLHRADRFVRLERPYPGEPRTSGFICGLGRALVAVEQYHDFYSEGHRALALDAIESTRADARERHTERILRAERLRPRRRSVPPRALEGWAALLAWLRRRGENVIIECEDRLESQHFFIGRIERVAGSAVHFTYFDALGRWDSELDRIPISEITSVQFGAPYIELMSRHLSG